MTEVKHTQGPWRVYGPSEPDNAGGCDYAILDTGNKIIAETFEVVGQDLIRPAKDNAEFIVRACNAHYDLVAALENSQKVFEGLGYRHKGVWVVNRDALAKAVQS